MFRACSKRQTCERSVFPPVCFWHVVGLMGASDRWSASLVTENRRPCLRVSSLRIRLRRADEESHEAWMIESRDGISGGMPRDRECFLIYNCTVRRHPGEDEFSVESDSSPTFSLTSLPEEIFLSSQPHLACPASRQLRSRFCGRVCC